MTYVDVDDNMGYKITKMKKIKQRWYNIKVMKMIRRRRRRLTRVNHALLSGPARSRLIFFQLKDDLEKKKYF